MNMNEFAALCAEYTIAPQIALEAEAVRYALVWAKKTTNKATGEAIVRAALKRNY